MACQNARYCFENRACPICCCSMGVRRPIPPPLVTKHPGFFKALANNCKCEAHVLIKELDRYKCLTRKEERLVSELKDLRNTITRVVNSVLDDPCGDLEEVMKTVSQTAYAKRGSECKNYKALMAAADSPARDPFGILKSEIGNGYRDPSSFRYHPHEKPVIQPAREASFNRTPETIHKWHTHYPGQTEYIENYHNRAINDMKRILRYREPLPSSRRQYESD